LKGLMMAVTIFIFRSSGMGATGAH